jgi:hypothetical protein
VSKVLQKIPDTLQQAWESINNANSAHLNVGSLIEMIEHLVDSPFPIANSWTGDPAYLLHSIQQFIHTPFVVSTSNRRGQG